MRCHHEGRAPRCSFLLPGDWQVPTGGYRYDRRIAEGLEALGWCVEPLVLRGAFPQPSPAERAAALDRVAALPDDRLVLADGLAFGALPALAKREAERLRWIALVHHPLAFETGLNEATCASLFEDERRALACACGVIVTSAATARDLGRYGVDAARVRVVEPGTDPAPLARGSSGVGLALLCVATLTPRKGHALLLEALAGLRQHPWTLTCVGSTTRDAACAAALRQQVAALGLGDRVRLLGEVDEEQLDALYARADAFVLASWHEGYGMVLAEALARGLPIVACSGGAVAETLPAAAALLVPPGDVSALRAALARLVADAPTRAGLTAGARAARESLATWSAQAQRFAEALTQLSSAARP